MNDLMQYYEQSDGGESGDHECYNHIDHLYPEELTYSQILCP